MFLDAAGLILADDRRLHLSELTRLRAFAAVPFAGRFRLIDFALSNLVNSGITRVGVATSNKYKSLMDHLGTGSDWDLDRRTQGLHILPPYLASDNYYDEGDDLKGALDFLLSSKNEYIVVTTANNIYSADYSQYFLKHEESGADVSVLFNREIPNDGINLVLDIDENDKVTELYVNPQDRSVTANSIGVVILKKSLLENIVSNAISRGISRLTLELILRKYDELDIRAFEYDGTVLRINTVQSYFEASMKILDRQINKDIFWTENLVYTKVKDEAPAFISDKAEVENSLVSDGCLVEGSVKDTVLFRSTDVGEGSCLENCVIMQGSRIGKNVKLKNVILDKDCVIKDGTELQGEENYPVVIGKGAIV